MQLLYDPWQKEFLEHVGDKILCCGRQVGKSEICAKDAGDYAINNPKSKPIVMIAPTERQAYALFEKTLNYLLENFKNWIKMGKERPTQTKITLKSGVRIYCLPVGISGLGIRFLTIGRLYVDEASRIPEDVWTAVTPALLTTGGDTILLSTPFGKKGEFYRTWINKNNAYKSFKRFSIDSEKVVREREICETWTITQREKALIKLEQAKARMSEAMYAQEYMGQFMDSLTQLFPDELLKTTLILKRKTTIITNKKYYLGVDCAGAGKDLNTFEIVEKINKETINQVESITTKKQFTTETTRKIITLEQQYNFKKIGIDDGGVGFGVFSGLMEAKETKRKTIALNNASRETDFEGLKSKTLLKEDMYHETLKLMQEGKLKCLDDEEVFQSLRSVQGEYIIKEGHKPIYRIHGEDTHIAEGIIRAVWLASKDKSLNNFVHYF